MGLMKTVGGFRRTQYRGLDRAGLAGYPLATAYILVRIAKLLLVQERLFYQVCFNRGWEPGSVYR